MSCKMLCTDVSLDIRTPCTSESLDLGFGTSFVPHGYSDGLKEA